MSLATSFNQIIRMAFAQPHTRCTGGRWDPLASSTQRPQAEQGAFVSRCNKWIVLWLWRRWVFVGTKWMADSYKVLCRIGDVRGQGPGPSVCVSMCAKMNWWGNYGWFHVYLSIKILMYVPGSRDWARASTRPLSNWLAEDGRCYCNLEGFSENGIRSFWLNCLKINRIWHDKQG